MNTKQSVRILFLCLASWPLYECKSTRAPEFARERPLESAHAAQNSLASGESLGMNESLYSRNGAWRLTYQSDGNLVLYRHADGIAFWHSKTWTSPGRCIMEVDGAVTVADKNGFKKTIIANQGTAKNKLVLQDNGNLQLIAPTGAVAWNSADNLNVQGYNGSCGLGNAGGRVDLRLYVAGLNHVQEGVPDKYVDQAGVDELAEYIKRDGGGEEVIVALSASCRASCDGTATEFNGSCLAHALTKKMNIPFKYVGYPRPGWNDILGPKAGSGFIVGPRWQIEDAVPYYGTVGEEFTWAVNIRDTLQAPGSAGSRASFYLFHTSGNDVALPAYKFGVAQSKRLFRTGDLLPMFAGDFNLIASERRGCPREPVDPKCLGPNCCTDEVTKFAGANLTWLNKDVRCASSGLGFGMQESKMQLFEGSSDNYRCSGGSLVPTWLSFTTLANGVPDKPAFGIQMSAIGHNVIGMGFMVQHGSQCDPPPPACQSPRIACGAHCVDPRSDVEHCGGCDNHTCRDGEQCVNSQCQTDHACRRPTPVACECSPTGCAASAARCNVICSGH